MEGEEWRGKGKGGGEQDHPVARNVRYEMCTDSRWLDLLFFHTLPSIHHLYYALSILGDRKIGRGKEGGRKRGRKGGREGGKEGGREEERDNEG